VDWPQAGASAIRAGAVDVLTKQRLVSLVRASQLINSSLVLEEVLQRVLDALIEVTGAERGFLVLADQPGGELTVKVARNYERRTLAEETFQISQTLLTRVIQTGQAIHCVDALADPTYSRFASVTDLQLRSILAAPLKSRDKTLGAVYVDSRLRAGVFDDDDLELMAAFASQAAAAIENARLYQDLRLQIAEVAALRDYQENVLRSTANAIITLDPDGLITVFNGAAETIFGISSDDAIGRPYHEVLGLTVTTRLLSRMARVMSRGERVAEIEIDGPLNGRERAVLRISLSPLKSSIDGGQRGLGVVLVADDVTEARLAAEASAREAAEKERIRALFGHYVAPSVVEHLLASTEQLRLGGSRQQVSVLFADIRGFSAMAETLPPEEVVALLNRYLGVATNSILCDGGTLDKYIGDAVMAFFNAPLPQEDHALQAVRAAALLQRAVRAEAAAGGPAVGFGVGVNTGEAIVGNIGTPQLMNYTVIGDAVNVAQRLQSVACAGEVLLSESTYEAVKDHVDAEELPPIEVKGRRAPVRAYRLRDVEL